MRIWLPIRRRRQMSSISDSIRRMTSRWGSCNVKTRQITLNTRLAEYQETALLAVLYHEVTHLLCPDHSQKFYRELLRRCPRYREWTEVLK